MGWIQLEVNSSPLLSCHLCARKYALKQASLPRSDYLCVLFWCEKWSELLVDPLRIVTWGSFRLFSLFCIFFALCKLSQLLWAGSRIDILKIIVCAVHKVSVFGGSQVGGDRAVKGVLGACCWRWCRQADVYSLLKCKLEAQVKMARPNEQFGR